MIKRIGQVVFLSMTLAVCLFFWGCQKGGVSPDTEPAKASPASAAKGILLGDLPGARRVEWQVEPTGLINSLTTAHGERIAAELPVDSAMVFKLGQGKFLDLSKITHVSFDVENPGDVVSLRVTLESSAGPWLSKEFQLRRGDNNILLPIHRLWRRADFAPTRVSSIAIDLPGRFKPANIELGRVRLTNRSRLITDVPVGFVLRKIGGDYTLDIRDDKQVAISRGDDGLWRFGLHQPVMRLAGSGYKPASTGGEDIDIMGSLRIGKLELIEHNSLRVRFKNSWYFLNASDNADLATARSIVWNHTIYSDGRWICETSLDNAGGREIDSVQIAMMSGQGAWFGIGVSRVLKVNDFIGPQGRWCYMFADKSVANTEYVKNYMNPGKLAPIYALGGVCLAGDGGNDRFDESQGCYYIGGKDGGCRFDFVPNGVAQHPVFIILGPWKNIPTVAVSGKKIRPVEMLSNSSAMFMLPGLVETPLRMEVFGSVQNPKKR